MATALETIQLFQDTEKIEYLNVNEIRADHFLSGHLHSELKNIRYSDMRLHIAVLSALLLFACGNPDSDATRHDSIEAAKDSMRAVEETIESEKNGCFQSVHDYSQFIPDSIAKLERTHETLWMYRDVDTLEHNRIYAEYSDGYGNIIKVRIIEYCASPEMMAVDYSMKYEMHKGVGEFNEFDVPPTHHGFSFYHDRDGAYVLVAVDGRFLVEIEEPGAKNSKNVLSIYEGLPIPALAEFRR